MLNLIVHLHHTPTITAAGETLNSFSLRLRTRYKYLELSYWIFIFSSVYRVNRKPDIFTTIYPWFQSRHACVLSLAHTHTHHTLG